jgi:hypothetical protein
MAEIFCRKWPKFFGENGRNIWRQFAMIASTANALSVDEEVGEFSPLDLAGQVFRELGSIL